MILQYIGSLLMLGFGLTGLLVARRLLHPIPHRLAWTMAGTAFTYAGVIAITQHVFGTFALVAGQDSPTWKRYLGWAPTFDHSRTGLLATLFLLLAFVLVPHRPHAVVAKGGLPRSRCVPALLVGGTVGALLGWLQGWDFLLHFRNVAVGDTTELLLVLASLFALLLRDRVDRLLWLALALYAVTLAMNVLWLSAWMQTSQSSGVLSLTHMLVSRVVVGSLMAGLAMRRLVLATRGVPVPSLLASLPLRGTAPRRML